MDVVIVMGIHKHTYASKFNPKQHGDLYIDAAFNVSTLEQLANLHLFEQKLLNASFATKTREDPSAIEHFYDWLTVFLMVLP